MDEGKEIPETAERAFWSWLGFWLQLLLLGVLAIIGAFFASSAARPGDYALRPDVDPRNGRVGFFAPQESARRRGQLWQFSLCPTT